MPAFDGACSMLTCMLLRSGSSKGGVVAGAMQLITVASWVCVVGTCMCCALQGFHKVGAGPDVGHYPFPEATVMRSL
jgi:hypothetical protein